MSQSISVLVVEDDKDILYLISHHLEKEGYHVYKAANGKEALSFLNDEQIDLAILDIMLPEMPGTDICKFIRKSERHHGIPVVFVSARGELSDRLLGFELGADDYLVKPFSPFELQARVRSLLKRSKGLNEHYQFRNFEVFFDRHFLRADFQTVHLSPREFKVLQILIENKHKTLSRDMLLAKVWGLDSRSGSRSVDVVMTRLREKIKPYDVCLKTITGFGYQWTEDVPVLTSAEVRASGIERS